MAGLDVAGLKPSCRLSALADRAPGAGGRERSAEVVGREPGREAEVGVGPVMLEPASGQKHRVAGHRARVVVAALDLVERVALARRHSGRGWRA